MASQYLSAYLGGLASRLIDDSGVKRKIIGLINGYGNIGIRTASQYRLSALNAAPSGATDTGTTGEIRITATYLYVCIATDTWVRAALTTW